MRRPSSTRPLPCSASRLDPTATQNGVTAFLNGLSTLTQGVDATVNYPTDFGDRGLVNWTLAGNFNETSIGSIAPVPAVLLAANPNATFFNFGTQFGFTHSLPELEDRPDGGLVAG